MADFLINGNSGMRLGFTALFQSLAMLKIKQRQLSITCFTTKTLRPLLHVDLFNVLVFQILLQVLLKELLQLPKQQVEAIRRQILGVANMEI